MPKPYPKEFRDDVVRVARNREPGTLLKQIAADFGVSESCLNGWLRTADVDDDVKPGVSAKEHAELREAKKRIRFLEQENEVLRRAAAHLSQAWATREELLIAIVTWIEKTYHRRRRQDALGRLTPIEFETIMTTPASQAA